VLEEQRQLKALRKAMLIRDKKRSSIYIHVVLCFVFQMVLTITIAIYLLTN
jgi:hypothetical protein